MGVLKETAKDSGTESEGNMPLSLMTSLNAKDLISEKAAFPLF